MMRSCCLLILLAAMLGTCGASEEGSPCGMLPVGLVRRLLHQEPNYMVEELGKVTDDEGALTRTFLSPAHTKAAALLQEWMSQAGMTAWQDDVANVHGRAESPSENATAVVIGSHYDTVVDGGKFDGAMGIILGIAAVKARLVEAALCQGYLSLEALRGQAKEGLLDLRQLLKEKALDLLPYPVEVIAFSDEEGVRWRARVNGQRSGLIFPSTGRFQSTFLGSRAVAGELGGIYSMTDAGGRSIREALEQADKQTSEDAVKAMQLQKDKVRAYVELHIEQGPVLEGRNMPVGVVTAIAGQTRLFFSVVGEQGHAGTVPMAMRKDPFPAAGLVIGKLEELCSPSPENNKMGLVCTVGAIHVYPNAGNVIPRYTNFTLDIRCQSDEKRQQVVRDIRQYFQETCDRRRLSCEQVLKNEAQSVYADPALAQELMRAATTALAYFPQLQAEEATSCGAQGACEAPLAAVEPPTLVSGAGHDAMVMAGLTKMGMLFVRCKGGISHSAEEYASPDDMSVAAIAAYAFLRQQ